MLLRGFRVSCAVQDYFFLYEEMLPEALPTLLGALGSEPLLQHLQRSRRSTTPMVEAAIDTALLLSFGGRTQEQQDEELRIIRREFNDMKRVSERRRRRRGYQSSSSEEEGSEGESERRVGFVENDKMLSLKAFREAQEALQKQQELRQKEGMRVLLPHIGLLLHSIEMLLAARQGTKAPKRSSAEAEAPEASELAGELVAHDDSLPPPRHRRDKALLVGFKELQLLTRLASHACSEECLQQQQQQQHAGALGAVTAAKIIRLLLLSLPLRVRSGGAAARQQLTLEAIKGLLPAIARWRRLLGDNPSASGELRELRELLWGLHAAACGLLDSSRDLQCRAAASEMLLATELAACGCQVTEEVLGSRIRSLALKQLAAYRSAEEDGEELETKSGSTSEGLWLSRLLPGGSVLSSLLEQTNASALPSLFVTHAKGAPASTCRLQGEWRVSVALVLVCSNLLKGGSGAPDEEKPDVDMHVQVLLALVEKYLLPPALTQDSQGPAAGRHTQDADTIAQGQQLPEATETEQQSKEVRGAFERALVWATQHQREQGQAENKLYVPAAALKPLIHHVLYLLSDCSDDLALQQVALTVIRKAAIALGAAASAAATRRAAIQFASQQQQQQHPGSNGAEVEADWLYATSMQHHLIKIVIPHLRRLLRSLKDDSQRLALMAFDAIVRTLGPAGPLLPPTRVAAAYEGEDGQESPSPLFLSAADEAHRNMRLHLDLYGLLTPTKLTPAVEEAAALAQQLVAQGDAAGAAAAAARAAQLEALAGDMQASEREGGGDVLLELLHMQKHRRARGLQILCKAAAAQRLCANTLKHFCIPLAMSAVLQQDSDAQNKQRQGGKGASRRYRGHTEAFSQQVAEQGVTCLAQCCTRLSLKCCTQTLRQLVNQLTHVPQREGFIHRAIAATIKAFPFGLSDAVQQALLPQQQGPAEALAATEEKQVATTAVVQQTLKKDPPKPLTAAIDGELSSADEDSEEEGAVASLSAAESR